MARQYCSHCSKPLVACICGYLTRQENKKAVIVLQHPNEQNKAIGTANIIPLSLVNAQVISSVDIPQSHVETVLRAMSCSRPLLVYPKPLSETAQHYVHDFEKDYSTSMHLKNLYDSIILLDGTWRNTRELLHRNEWIKTLPTLQIENAGVSDYRIRQAHTTGALATIEAASKVLALLDDTFQEDKLLKPFEKMIEFQIKQMGAHIYKQNYLDNKKK